MLNTNLTLFRGYKGYATVPEAYVISTVYLSVCLVVNSLSKWISPSIRIYLIFLHLRTAIHYLKMFLSTSASHYVSVIYEPHSLLRYTADYFPFLRLSLYFFYSTTPIWRMLPFFYPNYIAMIIRRW